VVGLGAVAGQAKLCQPELAGRKAKRVRPWVEWMGGSAGGCWAERLVLWGSRRAEVWVGLVGHAEWPAGNRSEYRPVPAERIRRAWGVKECASMGPVVGLEEVASGEWRVTSDNSRAFGRTVRQMVGRAARVAGRWRPEGRRYGGARAGSGSRGCG